MRPQLTQGKWFRIKDEAEFDDIQRYGEYGRVFSSADVQKGSWCGPGKYMFLSYSQKCPRGCCYDDVHELLTPSEVVDEIESKIGDLAAVLNTAKDIVRHAM